MKRLKLHKGDTLLEVIIALAILTVVLTAATISALRSFRSADLARERTTAYFLAQRQADALRAYGRSMIWKDFINTSNANGVGQFVGATTTCMSSAACKYPRTGNLYGAANPNLSAAQITALPGLDATDINARKFYMGYNGAGTSWAISPDGKAAMMSDGKSANNNGLFIVTIVANKANLDTTGSIYSNIINPTDVLRFDIKVWWQSGIGKSTNRYEEASLAIYMAKSEGLGK